MEFKFDDYSTTELLRRQHSVFLIITSRSRGDNYE